MKNKHNMVPARNNKAIHTGQQFRQSTPIITPISISEPALLQVEPNGPLQKVDANIDTEQICRLIESLGNVQKVNQVVILGQVPPHAPPLEVQQISQLAAPLHLNPPQNNFMGLKLPESKMGELNLSNSTCDPMEQTIILEPITPDGQLINPPFSETASCILAGGTVGLNNPEPSINSCDPMEQTIILEPITPDGQLENCFPGEAPGELRFIESVRTESEAIPLLPQQLPQQTGAAALQSDMFADNLEQTVILELTPAVMPNEQSHAEPQHDSSELEKITAKQTRQSDPPLPHTLELEEHHICSSPQIPHELHKDPKDGTQSQLQKINLDDNSPTLDGAQATQEKTDQEASKKECPEQVEDLSKPEEPSAKEKDVSRVETKQASQVPLNTMSAQELVKVRKRKPSRAYFFQEYMQELVGSIYKDDLQIKAKPAKRQRTKKARLVVKFGPQSKEKKNKEKKTSQRRKRSQEDAIVAKTQVANLPKKKGASQKKGRKGKGNKNARHLASTPKNKSSTPSHDSPARQIKDARRNKMKGQKEVAAEGATQTGEHATVDTPAFKKTKKAKIMRKVQPKEAKEGKRKKKRAEETEKRSPASADVAPDALLLLKGHKQPQLRVYKLDTSRAAGHAREASAQQSQTSPQQDTSVDHCTEIRNDLSAEAKKIGGRRKKNQKALSLLSSLKVPRQQPETLPSKPKTTRKRKASSKVETEGVITSSSSKRALECHDCGERFGEVSSLQKHKATVHVLDSPGLTYTNGNIFEGVTSSDFYHLPKQDRMVIGVVNTATGWDTEPELGEAASEDREPGVSFPALIPSPSLPVPPSDVVMMNEDTGTSKLGAAVPSASGLNHETLQNSENQEPTMAVGKEQEAVKDVHDGADEDIKEDLLLEVDLVTVGGHEKDDLPCPVVPVGQSEANKTCEGRSKSAALAHGESEKSVSLQTCSAHHMEVKEEQEEDISVQKKKAARSGELDRATVNRGGTGRQSSAAPEMGGAVCTTRSEEGEQECQVVYEEHAVSSDSEMNDGSEAGVKSSELENVTETEADESIASSPPVASTLEESPEEPAALGLKPSNTGVEEALNDRGEDHSRQQSPAIILEKFLTSAQAPAVRKLIAATNKEVS